MKKVILIGLLLTTVLLGPVYAQPISSLAGTDVNLDAAKGVSICAGTGDVVIATDCSGGGTQTSWKFNNSTGNLEGALSATSLLLPNDTYLTASGASSGTAGLIKADSSDNTFLNAITGKLGKFGVNSSLVGYWNNVGLRLSGTATSIDSDITDNSGSSVVLHVQGNSNGADPVTFVDIGNDAGAFTLDFFKTRSSAADANTVVQDADGLGVLRFYGADGAAYRSAAAIQAYVDGTPGSSDMPGGLVFRTASDGSANLANRWRIRQNGKLINDTTGGANLELSKAGTTLALQEGTAASACMGTATANGITGTTVATSCVTATSRIFISRSSAPSGTAQCWTDTLVAGTSFLLDCSGAETGTFNWMIVHEAE